MDDRAPVTNNIYDERGYFKHKMHMYFFDYLSKDKIVDIFCNSVNTFSFKVYNVPRCKARMFKRGMCELEPKTEKTKETTLLDRGYLVETDSEFIRKNKVSPIEISRYTDGWYSCFPYVELYQSFDKAVIKEQHLDIIHTALYAKTHSLKSTGNWYKCADTMLALLDWCEVDLDWVEIFKIFRKFIDLSFITFLQA